jgi:hypothetical protein
MRGMAAGIQDMLVPMGLARDEAAQMSVDMIELAGDLASFNNVPTTRMLEAMQSALAGSSEPMRRFGVDTRVTRLEQIALRDGLIASGEEMDNAARAAATMTAIIEDSSDASGDAGRTFDSTANQLRRMRRNFKQLQEDLGNAILPAFSELLNKLNDNEDGMSSLESTSRSLFQMVGRLAQGAVLAAEGFSNLGRVIARVAGEVSFFFEDLANAKQIQDTLAGDASDEVTRRFEQNSRMRAEFRQAFSEDFNETRNNLRDLFDAIGASVDNLSGQMDRTLEESEELAGGMNELGGATGLAGDEADEASAKFGTLLDYFISFNDVIEEGAGRADAYAEEIKRLANNLMQAAVGFRIFGQESQRANSGMGGGLPGSQIDEYLDKMEEVKRQTQEAAAIEWTFENTIDSVHSLASAMRQLGDDIAVIDAQVEAGGISQMQGMLAKTGMAANAVFGAMMQGVDQTSKEYEKLERAQQIVNVALGIAAILQQGMGDPYTAIPRMIAMAAMVASLGVDAGGISGGTSARRQEQQGTGSVLGDPTAKSESIEKAIEITADATSQLVGINRGMLHALQTMQEGISGAATQLARGPDAEFGKMNLDLGFFNDISNDIWDPFGFFSSTKVKDEGIKLIGGAIADMTEGSVAEAFQIVKKKGLFGSSTKTGTAALDDALNDQINLIFQSMIDTVTSAGEALGIPLEQIEARIAAFEVAAQEISLKDLDAEEQQAELEAVFSRIFDDLASSVIPFIDQFQKIGEGMGETLVRVATSVQVAQEAIKRLGLSIDENLGPEAMAQFSVGLVEAAGGIEQFITDMENFVSKFAPEAHKLAIAQSDITRALEQMGIELPETREGFWNLIQTIDGSTEAGQRQIATLLGLADAADKHYSNIEAVQKEREGLERRLLELQGRTGALRALELEQLDASNRAMQERVWALEREQERVEDLSGLMDEVGDVVRDAMSPALSSLQAVISRWNDLYDQAQKLGASERQLMLIRRAAEMELARWVGEMRLSTLRLAEDFFSVDQAFSQVGSSISSTVSNMRDVALRALASIDDWLMSSQIDSNSPLPPAQQLAAAEANFMQAFEAAMGGDFDALADLPSLADAFLGQAGSFYGTSTDQYNDIWQMVQGMMNDAADIDLPREQQPVNAAQIDTLNNTTSAFASDISALEQEMRAWELADKINALATATNNTPAEIADQLGFSSQHMRDVLEALGEDIPSGTEEQLRQKFNEVVGSIDDQNPMLEAMDANTWWQRFYGKNQLLALYDILGKLDPELPPTPIPSPPDDPPEYDSFGTYTNSSIASPDLRIESSRGSSQDMSEVKRELNRISRLVERGNDDRRTGLGAVVREEQSTKRAIERKKETVRAV